MWVAGGAPKQEVREKVNKGRKTEYMNEKGSKKTSTEATVNR